MRMWIVSVVLLFTVSLPVMAETQPAEHGGAATPAAGYPASPADPQRPQPDKSGKLYKYINACLADRPGTNPTQQTDAGRQMLNQGSY